MLGNGLRGRLEIRIGREGIIEVLVKSLDCLCCGFYWLPLSWKFVCERWLGDRLLHRFGRLLYLLWWLHIFGRSLLGTALISHLFGVLPFPCG
jgi:hypothetical protein